MLKEHEEIWIDIANKTQTISTGQLLILLNDLETYFDDQADTELGDFLEMFAQILFENSANNTIDQVHQDVQDLLDVCDLNEQMLECVGSDVHERLRMIMSLV
jgi:hypothetical protein